MEGHYICTFPSIASACESIDGSKSNAVCAAVNPNRQGDIAYGYQWKYDTGDHSDIKPYKYKVKKTVLQIDISTNEIINEYPSIFGQHNRVGITINIQKAFVKRLF